jgi:hypothetical protein
MLLLLLLLPCSCRLLLSGAWQQLLLQLLGCRHMLLV